MRQPPEIPLNPGGTAAELGISRMTLYTKFRRYGLMADEA